MVYEWAEDYYHKDEKAEVEKEKAKPKATGQLGSAKDSKKKDKLEPKSKKAESTQEEKLKPTKSKKDMEGQFSLFDMF